MGGFSSRTVGWQRLSVSKTAAELALGARIVAVADVFTALREERPYRSGLAWPEIQRILTEQAQAKALDARVVETLLSSRSRLDANGSN